MGSQLVQHPADRGDPGGLEQLPPFPPAALRAVELLSKEDVDTKEIVRACGADSVFVGELLCIANSSLFGFSKEVNSVQAAVVLLGRERVTGLVMTVAMRSYGQKVSKSPQFQRWWKHSLASALLAQDLASAGGLDPEAAYLAGLLHSVGRLGIMMTTLPEDYEEFFRYAQLGAEDALKAEREYFGIDHCEAGAWLLEEWKLPADLIAAAAHHKGEIKWGTPGFVAVTGYACRLADILGFTAVTVLNRGTVEDVRNELPFRVEGLSDPERFKADLRDRIDSIA